MLVRHDKLHYLLGTGVGVDEVDGRRGPPRWWCGLGAGRVGVVVRRDAGVAATDVDDDEICAARGGYRDYRAQHGEEVHSGREVGRACACLEVASGVEQEGVLEGEAAQMIGRDA